MEILQKQIDEYFKFRMNAWMGQQIDFRKYINSNIYWNVHFNIREDWGSNAISDIVEDLIWNYIWTNHVWTKKKTI